MVIRFRPGAAAARSGSWVVVASLTLAGCAPAPKPPTVAEFRARATLRAAVLARCANNPGELRNTPDCVNASEAERLEGLGNLRSLAPLAVPPASRVSGSQR